jgi:hypothetical protein
METQASFPNNSTVPCARKLWEKFSFSLGEELFSCTFLIQSEILFRLSVWLREGTINKNHLLAVELWSRPDQSLLKQISIAVMKASRDRSDGKEQ